MLAPPIEILWLSSALEQCSQRARAFTLAPRFPGRKHLSSGGEELTGIPTWPGSLISSCVFLASTSSRNRGRQLIENRERHHLGMGGDIISEWRGDIARNRHPIGKIGREELQPWRHSGQGLRLRPHPATARWCSMRSQPGAITSPECNSATGTTCITSVRRFRHGRDCHRSP